jgi:hypothetical protein
MFLDKQQEYIWFRENKNICGLGVGVSIVFEIFSNFLFLVGWGGP